MTQHVTPPKAGTAEQWQKLARRIRVPLGFLTAAVYLVEVARRPPHPTAIAWSLALVLPGLALRAAASGTVKKNQELTVTGPYAYTRNPLYLGSTLIAAGFAVALLSWPVALLLAFGFAAIYIPVIASEERFLRATFPQFDVYCRSVPRFIPRLTPANCLRNWAYPLFPSQLPQRLRVASHSPFTSSTASTILL
jgi:protein-S-isoprenylcysteine O-methyltransferase Ste14